MIIAFFETVLNQMVLWEKILAAIVGGCGSLFIIFRLLKGFFKNVKEANDSLSEFLDIIPELKKMTKEFGSNGNSLKDVLYRLENNLGHSDQKIKVIASYMGIAAFETDKKGLYTFVSRKWAEITGITAESAMGNGWINIVDEDSREDVYREWISCASQNREFHSVINLSNYPEKEVSIVAWPIRNLDGSVEKFFGVII